MNITGGSDTSDQKIKVGLVGTARPKTSLVASLLVASTILVVLLSGAAFLWWLLLLRSSPDDDSGFHGPSAGGGGGGGGDPGGENGGWWNSVVRFVNSIPREVAIVAIVVLLLFSLYVAAGIAFIASPRLQAAFFAGSIFSFGPEEGEELKQASYADQLPGLINFRMVKEDDGGPMISLGAWYVPPWPQPSHFSTQGLPTRIADLNLEADRRLVVLCAHGSAGTRAEPSRRKLYEVLARRLAYHVVAFEYRGNGDSSDGTAGAGPVRWTCPALAEDAFIAYSWLRVEKRVPPERILLWGHSLGTAVLVEMLTTRTSGSGLGSPLGAILEAALSSMVDVIREANFGPAINCARATVPLLQRTVLSVLARSPDFSFDSLAKVDRLPCPLLFLHATDDEEIEVELGRKLFDAVKERAPPAAKAKSRFQDFPSGGHMDIVLQYEEVVAEIVRRFVASLATSSA